MQSEPLRFHLGDMSVLKFPLVVEAANNAFVVSEVNFCLKG
jgi:hypothetical protein